MTLNNLIAHFSTQPLKNRIVDVLSENTLLSAKEIYTRVQREKEISYQAVHKALTELYNKKVIEKEKHKYQISLEWIDREIHKLNHAKKLYLGKEKLINLTNPEGEYKFTNWTELCITFAKFFATMGSERDNKQTAILKYGW